MKVNVLKTQKGFNNALEAFTTVSSKIDGMVHQLLLSALALAAPANGGDNNVDRLRLVLSKLPKSSRLKAAIKWANDFAPVTIRQDPKTGITVTLRKDAKGTNWSFDVDAAMDSPFWEYTKERNPGPVDLRSMLSNVASMAQKVLAGEKESKQDPDEAARISAGIEGLIATLKA